MEGGVETSPLRRMWQRKIIELQTDNLGPRAVAVAQGKCDTRAACRREHLMFCRHPRLPTLPQGLFDGLASFRDLEARIAPLPEELQRGDALEVFVEAYLQTHPLFQVADLWLVGQIPAEVRKALNLPKDAKGIDGVFRTRCGSLVPYQVKFRIGRPQVGVREVSTFLGLTERAKDRLLISNSDRYAGDIENRDRLRILTGTYFDSLASDELKAIAAWLKGRPEKPTPAVPRPHQQAAITDIAAVLATEDRATAIMACGTGKTLVGLRVAEAMEPRTVLVLVPSLALLSQALADWSRDNTWGTRFEYLCVCSDPSVAQAVDEWTVRSTETPFPVQTDSKVVREFLCRPALGEVRVVFSTYQSAPIVAKGVPRGVAFDVAIFDEAHKTAGVGSGTFTFALEDRRLRIRKRLFLTATPRQIDIQRKDSEGEFRVVSMDDQAVYGRRAHELSFARAVKAGIICDYKVIVSAVEPEEISATALRHGITLLKGDKHATQWVATQIAVQKAIRQTGAKKVITFHSRVEQAKRLASNSSKGIKLFLPEFAVGHVNGSDPVAQRKEVLADFSSPRKQIVTNARCLTEGVNLPAVDMVVFCNPRKSKIDIIQAVGRAMRKPRNSNKACGYVVVPVLLPPIAADDLETSCANTDWEDIVAVLAALREQDGRIDDVLCEQQVALGAGKTLSPRTFADRVAVIGPYVAVSMLQRHLSSVIVDRLGVAWDRRFGELLLFKSQKGHCNVPAIFPANPMLGLWLHNQRRNKKRGILSQNRIARLEAIGVVWDSLESSWESQYAALLAFKRRTGHCNVPRHYEHDPGLSFWLNRQRHAKKRGQLSADRVARLEAAGIGWSSKEASWDKRCAELQAFKETEGHCNVPYGAGPHKALGGWVAQQRSRKRKGQLRPDRVARLEALGFNWRVLISDSDWANLYEELVRFQAEHGHCNVPQKSATGSQLGRWLTRQRQAYTRGTLSPDRVSRLLHIGVVFDNRRPVAEFWERQLEALTAFKRKTGHCNVPYGDRRKRQLWTWLDTQRQRKRKGKMPECQRLQLESLGVVWEPVKNEWDKHYAALLEFKAQAGHCNVPPTYKANPQLGRWLSMQRRKNRLGTLSTRKIRILEDLGVEWEPRDARWEGQCRDLRKFYEENGHCELRYGDAQTLSLWHWLSVQRGLRRKGKLSAERVSRLESIGVSWEVAETFWDARFRELQKFAAEEGHCDVPQNYGENPGLGAWVARQRKLRREKTLSADRIKQLTALGITWRPKKGPRSPSR